MNKKPDAWDLLTEKQKKDLIYFAFNFKEYEKKERIRLERMFYNDDEDEDYEKIEDLLGESIAKEFLRISPMAQEVFWGICEKCKIQKDYREIYNLESAKIFLRSLIVSYYTKYKHYEKIGDLEKANFYNISYSFRIQQLEQLENYIKGDMGLSNLFEDENLFVDFLTEEADEYLGV